MKLNYFHLFLFLNLVFFSVRIHAKTGNDTNHQVPIFEEVFLTKGVTLNDALKNNVKESVRRLPLDIIQFYEEFQNELKSELSKEKKAFLYHLLTIAYYNVGQVSEATEYNQKELNTYPLFPYQLSDSLQAYSNSTILFYSLNQPIDAMNIAVKLHQRLVRYDLTEKIVPLYQQLATIYGLLQLENEAEEILMNILKKAEENNIKKENLSSVYNTLAYKELRSGDYDTARHYFSLVKEFLSQNPSLNRRYLAGMATYFEKINKVNSANDFYKQAFDAYKRYPDVISQARMFKNYMLFLKKNPSFINIEYLENGLVYLKQFENSDNEEIIYNIWTIEGYLNFFRGEINLMYALKQFEIDSLQTVLNNKYLNFLKTNRDYHYQKEINKVALDQLKSETKNAKSRLKSLYFILFLIALSFVFLVLFFRNQRKLQRTKISLQEKEADLYSKELERQNALNRQLEVERNAEKEKAENYAVQAEKQKALLNRLELVIQEVKSSETQAESVRILQNFNNEFKQFVGGLFEDEMMVKFQQNNSEKYTALKNVIGSDESSEFLLAILFLSGFSTKDASVSLGKSEKAIRSIRYRLRKLLNLDADTDLLEYLHHL